MSGVPCQLWNPAQTFYGSNVVLTGGLLYSYQAGTTTPQATYTDETGETPATNPLVLDSAGRVPVWITNQAYKFVLKDSSGNIQWTVDNVSWINPGTVTGAMLNADVAGEGLSQNEDTLALDVQVDGSTIDINDDNQVEVKPSGITPTQMNIAQALEVVFKNKRDDNLIGILAIPQWPWSNPSKLGAPGSNPPATPNVVKWSPNGEFVAVGSSATPFLTLYQRSGQTFTALPTPATIPDGNVNDIDWSPCGKYLACANNGGACVSIYERNGLTFFRLDDPTAPPGAANKGSIVKWSPNGDFLALSARHISPPNFYFKIYQKQGSPLPPTAGLLTKISGTGDSTINYYSYAANGFQPNTFSYTFFLTETMPAPSGTLTKVSGTGATTLTYSSVIASYSGAEIEIRLAAASVTAGAVYQDSGNNQYSALDTISTGTTLSLSVLGTNNATSGAVYADTNGTQYVVNATISSGAALTVTKSQLIDITAASGISTTNISDKYMSWSKDSSLFLISDSTNDSGMLIYGRLGTAFTNITGPGYAPTPPGTGVLTLQSGTGAPTLTYSGFTYSLGTYTFTISAASVTSGAIYADPLGGLYEVSTTISSGTTLTCTSSWPGIEIGGAAISPNGQILALLISSAPYILFYAISGYGLNATFSAIATPSTIPPEVLNCLSWSLNSKFLALGHSTTPFIFIYSVSGQTFVKLADPVAIPDNSVGCCHFSPTTQYLALGISGTPYLDFYQTQSEITQNAFLYTADLVDVY